MDCNRENTVVCDIFCRYRSHIRAVPLLAVLAWALSGCTLVQPPAPRPATLDCERQDREIVRLQQTLAEKDAEVQRLRAQQTVQAKTLKQITGEVARAEVKLRRLATQADAASQLAEVEVALQSMHAEASPRHGASQLAQAQSILDAGAESFSLGDYGAAVELAAQSRAILDMLASGRPRPAPDPRDAVELPFQAPVALRARIDSNLRTQPGRSEPVLSVLRQGTPLQAHAFRGEWLHVHTDDGRAGWVFGSLLEAPPPAAD